MSLLVEGENNKKKKEKQLNPKADKNRKIKKKRS